MQRPFHLKPEKWWEVVLNISKCTTPNKKYNPFGCGNELWATSGHEGIQSFESFDGKIRVEFADKTDDRGYPWRSCLNEGQLPHILLWPL